MGSMWGSEKPLRTGCKDQTEGNISCTVAASLHPRAHPPHSHVHIPCWRMCMCCKPQWAYDCLCFPLIVSIIHSSPCHAFASCFCSFCQSHPPYFDLCLLSSPTRSQSQKHAHAPIYPPTHAVGTTESVTSSTVWRGVMQRNTKISAV